MAYHGPPTPSSKPDNKNNGNGSGNGRWSGGTGGSGSNEAKEQKRYMQSYLQVIENLYGKTHFSPQQQKLAMRAFKLRFPASTYGDMLRRHDPMFVHSKLYRDRVTDAKNLYNQFRPGRPVPHDFVKNYAHSNMSLDTVQRKLERSKWFKREFAGWTEAQRAGSPAGNSPQTFLNYRTMWNNALQNTLGRPATPLEQKMMFSSAMTGDQVAQNMADLFGGQEALKWATGNMMGRQDLVKGALTSKYGQGRMNTVANAIKAQQGFMGSKSKSFDIGVDDLSGNLEQSGF